MKRKHTESQLQQACVRWFRYQYPQLVLFAIPNGGYRPGKEGAIMVGEGVLPGVPDLMLAEPCGKYHGLFVEMKSTTGSLTDNQKEVSGRLMTVRYCFATCRSFDEFERIITDYLNLK